MDVMQELESLLIVVGDLFLEDIAVPHSLKPVLRDFLGGEITLNILLFLLCQELLLVFKLFNSNSFITVDDGILGLDNRVFQL
jgi:hypothetical protein